MAKKRVFTDDLAIDWYRVFHRIPDLTGLELTLKNNKWEGRYYLNRERHQYKHDKLRIALWNGSIWLHEQGGESMSLPTWLIRYGGAVDYADAYRIIRTGDRPLLSMPEFRHTITPTEYIPRSIMEATRDFDLKKCPLFCHMARLFGADETRKVWDLYHVTTDTDGLAVFWYTNADGRICYDKRVRYLYNGHRDKKFGGTRKYKTADGYNERPFFGAHLLSEKKAPIHIVESEKTALLCALYYGGVWCATGGKNNLRGIGSDVLLYPDIDAVEDWSQYGTVVEWWRGWESCGEKSDIGDMIEWLVQRGR